MRYLSLFVLGLLPFLSNGQGCQATETKDKFTGQVLRETPYETLLNTNAQRLQIGFVQQDSLYSVKLNLTQNFHVFSIPEGGKLLFLTDKDSVIELTTGKGVMPEPKAGGGVNYYQGTALYRISPAQLARLNAANVASVRVYLREGYAETDLNQKKRRVIPALASCIRKN